jgi:hypothetical protein
VRIAPSLKTRENRKKYMARRSVNRSLAAVEQVLQQEDAREAAELHNKLVKLRQELHAASLGADQQEDEAQLQKLDQSIRKLAMKRREDINNKANESPFPQVAYKANFSRLVLQQVATDDQGEMRRGDGQSLRILIQERINFNESNHVIFCLT